MDTNDIALALSGGGVRAVAFHCGVLRYLAERGQLERIKCISTVSGGSLFVGLIFHHSRLVWPSSRAYLTDTAPLIREVISQQDLQRHSIARLLFRPQNWRHFLSRANVVAQGISELWGITEKLGDLPHSPEWSINGTTAETGKRFRFKLAQLGDYELGYADAADFPLASAMATSAAFPIGIGPLTIDVQKYRWARRPYWGASTDEVQPIAAPYRKLHIYDGGVYDNLGLESFYDLGQGKSKGAYKIIASDAGAPLSRGFDFWGLNPLRLKRLIDIMTEQTRSLRVRAFVDFLKKTNDGAYLSVGMVPSQLLTSCDSTVGAYTWLEATEIKTVRIFPTHLCKLPPPMFDLIERHGYETAFATDLAFPFTAQCT